jgi:hypothetical protein
MNLLTGNFAALSSVRLPCFLFATHKLHGSRTDVNFTYHTSTTSEKRKSISIYGIVQ